MIKRTSRSPRHPRPAATDYLEKSQLWMDHHYLNFWIWACLHDAEAYLESSREHQAALAKFFESARNNSRLSRVEDLAARNLMELKKYHFVMTVGSLLRHLHHVVPKFPAIKPAFDAAQHLRKEGSGLRNMIEHADKNLQAAARGAPRGGFARRSGAAGDLPGNARGIADATSTIVDKDGHWLGGRLNVERVVNELRGLLEAARAIPPPLVPMPSVDDLRQLAAKPRA
jgi:hypothetical protein